MFIPAGTLFKIHLNLSPAVKIYEMHAENDEPGLLQTRSGVITPFCPGGSRPFSVFNNLMEKLYPEFQLSAEGTPLFNGLPVKGWAMDEALGEAMKRIVERTKANHIVDTRGTKILVIVFGSSNAFFYS